jgi:hypothetical protein
MDKSLIPPGCYCYISLGVSKKDGKQAILKCPYHSVVKGAPEQENGYCNFLNEGDQDNSYHLLWDLVKSCDINDDIYFDDYIEMRKRIVQWMKNMMKKEKVPKRLLAKVILEIKEKKRG